MMHRHTPDSGVSPQSANVRKRTFQPFSDSRFCDSKKRRLLNGFQGVQPSFNRSFSQDPAPSGFSSVQTTPFHGKTRQNNAFSTPQCITRSADDLLTSEEKRELEINLRPKFKAKPVPRSLYVPSLVLRASDRPLTVPMDPLINLPPCRHQNCSISACRQTADFKALELNRTILDRPDFVPQRSGYYTVPKEFHLSGNQALTHSCSVQENPVPHFQARPVPNFSMVNLPKKRDFELTKPDGFHLETETRGAAKELSLEMKLRKEEFEAEKRRKFTSNPMPVFQTPKPIVSSKPLTVPQPFNLSTGNRYLLTHAEHVNFLSVFQAKNVPDFSNEFVPESVPCRQTPEIMEIEGEGGHLPNGSKGKCGFGGISVRENAGKLMNGDENIDPNRVQSSSRASTYVSEQSLAGHCESSMMLCDEDEEMTDFSG